MSVSAWEAVFMLVVLKLPLVYLGIVVWWAIRAEPQPVGGGDDVGVPAPLSPCGWDDWRRGRSSRPWTRPNRTPRRSARVSRAQVV
ncbi:MAG: hypothetical protein ACRDOF_11340 [Gaiellaceae bacterium]